MNPYINIEDEDIDLSDLVKFLLHRIGWILLAGVICACIVGACKYYSDKTNASDTNAESETETKQLETENYELESEKRGLESELISTSEESTLEVIKRQKDYLQNSLYMHMDPNHVWKAQTLVKVVSYDHDFPAYQLEELYKFAAGNIDSLADLARKRGTTAPYLKELIGTWSAGTAASETGDDTSDVILRDEDFDRVTSELFYVQAIGSSGQEAQELMDAVMKSLETAHESYAGEHPHDFQILSRRCVETVDFGMITTQKDREVITQNLLLQMKDNKDKTDQLLSTETEETEETEETAESVSGSESKKRLLKYALIGFVAGVLLMCLWYAVRYIRNDILVDYKDIARKGLLLKELGSVSDQGVAMAAVNIRNFAGERKKLFMTGMTTQEKFDETCSSLRDYLPEYEIVSARDALHDPEARELLLNCDAAVLVEQKGVTHYSDMINETTFLFNAGKEIIGVVIA